MSDGEFPGIEAVVFDLDGTLIDSIPDITLALNVAIEQAGLRSVSEQDVRGMVGHGARELVRDAVAAAAGGQAVTRSLDEIYSDYMVAYDAAPCVKTRVYPGVVDVLHRLGRAGIALGVCTNKPQSTTDLILSALGLGQVFGSIVGGRDGVALKPAPDMLRSVVAALGASPSTSVMVGDSAADAGAAHAAGLRLVLLSHGYGGAGFSTLEADAVVGSFQGLLETLRGLNGAATA